MTRLLALLLCATLVACSSSDADDDLQDGPKAKAPAPTWEDEPKAAPEAKKAQKLQRTWPREYENSKGKLIVYQPQIKKWDRYRSLKASAAIALTPKGSKGAVIGALDVSAETLTSFEQRQVWVHKRKIEDLRFPAASLSQTLELKELVKSLLPKDMIKISMDRVLAMLSQAQLDHPEVEVDHAPPPIRVSQEPAILVIFMGAPVFRAVEGTDLEFAVNTNWDVLRDPKTKRCFLRNKSTWLEAPDPLEGPWTVTKALPAGAAKLPATDNWKAARAAIPPKPLSAPAPKVFSVDRPSELILIKGKPVYTDVFPTGLTYVSNTESDVFRHTRSGTHYYLVSGRWFQSKSLAGPWAATNELPVGFTEIPFDHPRARVRVAIPGTPEAEEAVIMASIPRTATVDRKKVKLAVKVVYTGEPKFEAVEKLQVEYAANTAFDVLRFKAKYYLCHEGIWFVSDSATGPWVVCDSVPKEIYSIPSSHPKHNVTYVYVYDSSPDVVVVGYTGGYTGVYVASGVVVFGTGYAWGWYAAHSYGYHYYGHHHYAYGHHAYYSHYHGAYMSGGRSYGPYGGAGWGTRYNSSTGTYARGVGAYGPHGGTYAAQAYNPYTGASARTRQSYNSYSHWGSSVVSRGNNTVRTAHYGDSRGNVAGFQTNKGARGVAARGQYRSGGAVRTKNGDLYVGNKGNVYRRSSPGQWQQRSSKGTWQNTNHVSTQQRAQARQKAQTRVQQGYRGNRQPRQRSGNLNSQAWSRQRGAAQQRRNTQRGRSSWGSRSSGSARSRGSGGFNRGGGRSRGGGGRRR
jgi:hypothetical protein